MFAEYSLLAQQDIVDGNTLALHAAGITAPAPITNVSSANVSQQQRTQGVFLFGEDSTASENTGVGFIDPGVNPFAGDSWLRNVATGPGVPKGVEGVTVFPNHTVLSSVPSGIGADGSKLTAADLTALNAIALCWVWFVCNSIWTKHNFEL